MAGAAPSEDSETMVGEKAEAVRSAATSFDQADLISSQAVAWLTSTTPSPLYVKICHIGDRKQ